MIEIEALHRDAIALQQQGKWQAAEEKYRTLLHIDPYNPQLWSDLSWLYYCQGNYADAREAIAKSLTIAPQNSHHYCRLGLILEKLNELAAAAQAYQKAIALDSKFLEGYLNLGRLLLAVGNMPRAESIFRQAIAVNAAHADSYYYLGKIFLDDARLDAAIQAYQKALDLKPRDPQILTELGAAYAAQAADCQLRAAFYQGFGYYRQRHYAEAIPHFQAFLAGNKRNFADHSIERVYIHLASCYENLEQPKQAIQIYQQGIQENPKATELYFRLVNALQENGQVADAIAVASRGVEQVPNYRVLKHAQYLLLPILYQSLDEIEFYRQRFTQGLEKLIQETQLETVEQQQNALEGCATWTNFYLQYQGKNDRQLQQRYGQFVQQILKSNRPDLVQPIPMPPLEEDGKIRIGYISTCMYLHTVGKLSIGWLRHANRKKFKIYSYHLAPNQDFLTAQYQAYSDKFEQIPLLDNLDQPLQNCREKILRDRLHILVFLDIGQHSLSSLLAATRLAPIQCTTWGHPITSGLPTIDYFLSSDLMEPVEGETHYTEKLIRLPNLGISYAKPEIPTPKKSRADFQLRTDSIVYLSCQSIYKYLPQYDYIYPEIARRVPQAQFVFLGHKNSRITEIFQNRLQQAFARVGLNFANFCVILPRQTQVNYWNLNLVSDIFLDTFTWSGGNTTLEAIACNLPIVTCPGELMRSRHSYAILQMLGNTETIAKNAADYIEIAVKLGCDRGWREEIVKQMQQRHHFLYNDTTCVLALEEFYERVVQHSFS